MLSRPSSPQPPGPPVAWHDGSSPSPQLEPIEADEMYDDPGYHTASDATMSIASSADDFMYENGRRYHRYGGEGKYTLPNDQTEQERLDLMHHIHLMVLGGKLHLAPVDESGELPHRVLDCGTGTGIWALDYGELHPNAEVIGVDLSPIQPSWVFSNVRFEIDDLERDWIWPENYFDFIHARNIANGIRYFQRLMDQAFLHVKPGGYVELAEQGFDLHAQDASLTPDTAMYKFLEAFQAGTAQFGIEFPDPVMMEQTMKAAGFEDIHVQTRYIPWGPWAKNRRLKKLGATATLVGVAGFEAFGLAPMTRALGWDIDHAKQCCYDAYQEVVTGKVHCVQPVYQVYGRKPMQ